MARRRGHLLLELLLGRAGAHRAATDVGQSAPLLSEVLVLLLEGGDVREHRVERGRERFGVTLDLSQQEAALERGQQGQRELA